MGGICSIDEGECRYNIIVEHLEDVSKYLVGDLADRSCSIFCRDFREFELAKFESDCLEESNSERLLATTCVQSLRNCRYRGPAAEGTMRVAKISRMS